MNPAKQIPLDPVAVEKPQRVGLDERFISELLPESPLDRVESQELRQQVLKALDQLTREELKVVELRFQYKKSPGQVASKLSMEKSVVADLERSALEKIRTPIAEYLES
tara:strand:+ start:38 stop:364 length:327 start_codon:yes stop_codon:yes gene_type:complete